MLVLFFFVVQVLLTVQLGFIKIFGFLQKCIDVVLNQRFIIDPIDFLVAVESIQVTLYDTTRLLRMYHIDQIDCFL